MPSRHENKSIVMGHNNDLAKFKPKLTFNVSCLCSILNEERAFATNPLLHNLTT